MAEKKTVKKKQRRKFDMRKEVLRFGDDTLLMDYHALSDFLVKNLKPADLVDFVYDVISWADGDRLKVEELDRLIQLLEKVKQGRLKTNEQMEQIKKGRKNGRKEKNKEENS